MKKFEEDKIANPELVGLTGLVLDAQPRLLGGIERSEALSNSIEVFARSMNSLGVPLCVTEQVPQKLGPTEEGILEACSTSLLLSKDTFSAFGCPDFEMWINEHEVDHLLITGIETPICVYLTAVDAVRKGLTVTVLTDCVGCRRPEDGKWALRKLENLGCHLLPLESLLYAMLKSARHEEFRSISALVKDRTP
jgi:hypothetical protein